MKQLESIEQEIQTKGLTAPRVTPQDRSSECRTENLAVDGLCPSIRAFIPIAPVAIKNYPASAGFLLLEDLISDVDLPRI